MTTQMEMKWQYELYQKSDNLKVKFVRMKCSDTAIRQWEFEEG